MKNKSAFFKKKIITTSISSILIPINAGALQLSQSPPGTTESYVAPNVIISIDDSGSMDYKVTAQEDGSNQTGKGYTVPDDNGNWNGNAKRINVLKYAVKKVFENKNILPDHGTENTIRLSWQAMHNNGKSSGAGSVNNEDMKENSMRFLSGDHRNNFISFIDQLSAKDGTPTHKMMYQAHEYMAKRPDKFKNKKNSPWAYIPGTTAEPFLGCRRSYHIIMSDGGWQTAPTEDEKPKNTDNSENLKLPDGTIYNKQKPYSDNHANMVADWAFKSWSTNLQPDLYDPTKHDKQIPLTSAYRNADSVENFGTDKDGETATLTKYWNPRNNPANWPHLVTYTIGFSTAATNWPGEPNIKRPPNDKLVPFSYDAGFNGSLPDFINGKIEWPLLTSGTSGTFATKNPLDLWHSALNGRGRFYAVENPEDLERAFLEIIGTINTQAEPDRSSVAISGTSAERKPVGTFITFNEPKEAWRGGIKSFIVSNAGQTPAWGGKSTADILDDASVTQGNRTIITWNDQLKRGAPFRWADDGINMSQSQKNLLKMKSSSDSDSLGEARVNYIRGDRSLEGSADGKFRIRKSRQGDIVNSVIWYTGAPVSNYDQKGYGAFILKYKDRNPVVYAGGNDGMLHGFSSVNGKEVLAYVPRGSYQHLSKLSWKSFNDNHKYFVDGSPMTGDIDIADRSQSNYTPQWRTYLVGTMGGGGKGYFVLDVTKAGTSTEAHNFSEGNAENLVIMDKTMSPDENSSCTGTSCLEAEADIGHIFSSPATEETNPLKTNQITLLNNNRWAVIMGNGYNSANQRPVLLIQYLDGNKELLRIPATTEAECTDEEKKASESFKKTCHNVMDNGLSAPKLVDINGDNRPDIVYAGDIQGNVWKFYIGSKSSESWAPAFNGKPLFTAIGGTQGSPDSRTKRQPITAAPTVRSNDRSYTTGSGNTLQVHRVGGMMVSVGTGRNVTTADPSNTDVQTLYSVIDNTRYLVTLNNDDKKNYVSIHPGNTEKSIPAPITVGLGVANLSQQKIDTTNKYTGENISVNRDFVGMETQKTSAIDWSKHKGWYMDFPETGERLLKPLDLYDGSNILAVYSQVPAKGSNARVDVESCESTTVDAERQYLTLINIMDGQRPSVQLMDLNGDGLYNSLTDKNVSRQKIEKGAHTRIVDGKHIKDIGKEEEFNLARMPEQSMRPSWRQLK